MGRRDPDPRPPIEVLGADPELTSTQRVALGPKRPRRLTGRALAVGAGVAALLVGGLALGGDDDPPATSAERQERDNRERAELKDKTTTTSGRATSTTRGTTTTTIPVGPMFGQPVGGSLLVFGNGRWQVIELDTGARHELDLPSENPYEARAVRDGAVLLASLRREALYYDLRSGVPAPAPLVLGTADQVVSSGRPDQVWLLDSGWRAAGGPSLSTAQARLVDLTGEVLRSFDVPSSYVFGGFEAGLVIVRGGRAYLVDERGVRPLAVGDVLGTSPDSLIVFACDDRANCALELHPITGGAPVELRSLAGPIDYGFGAIAGPDGQIAILRYPGEAFAGGMSFFAADGRRLGDSGETVMPSFNGEPRWLPGDLGMVSPGTGGVEWIHRVGDEWVATDVEALAGIPAEVLVVIQP